MLSSESNRAAARDLRELGLPDAGRAEEDERADRPTRVLDAGAGPDDRVGDESHRLVLADHPLVQDLVEPQQLLPFALLEPADRDAGPGRHDLGDLVLGHDLPQQPAFADRLLELCSSSAAAVRSSSAMRP